MSQIADPFRSVEFFGSQFLDWYKSLSWTEQGAIDLTLEALESMPKLPSEWFYYPMLDRSLAVMTVARSKKPLSLISYHPHSSLWVVLHGCKVPPTEVSEDCLRHALLNRQAYQNTHLF